MSDEQTPSNTGTHAEQYGQLARNLRAFADRLRADAPPGFDDVDIAAAFVGVTAQLLIENIGPDGTVGMLRNLADAIEAGEPPRAN